MQQPEDYDDYEEYEANNLAWSTMMPEDYNNEAMQLAWTMKESGVDIRPTLGGFEINEEAGRPHPITGMSPSCCASSKHWAMEDGDWVCIGCGAAYAQTAVHALAQLSLPPLLPPTDLAEMDYGNIGMPSTSCCLWPSREAGHLQNRCDSCGQEYFDIRDDEDVQRAIEAGWFGTGGPTFGDSGISSGPQASSDWRNQGKRTPLILGED